MGRSPARRAICPSPWDTSPPVKKTAFDRKELNIILNLYGSKVAEGEWRDYALDFDIDKATFFDPKTENVLK